MGATNISNDVFVLLHFLLCMMNTISQAEKRKVIDMLLVLCCDAQLIFVLSVHCMQIHTLYVCTYKQHVHTYVCTHWQLFILREQT